MHEHSWHRDTTREHRRPPRFFVVCECGEKAQAVSNSGFWRIFLTKRPLGLVAISADIRAEQRDALRTTGNASETIRAALDMYFEKAYPQPQKH